MSCEDYPTAQTAKTFKLDAETVNEVVTLEQNRTNEASDGKTKKTLWGIETDATNQRNEFEQLASDQRDNFEVSFSSQFNFKRIGNISDYAGQSLPDADKLNSYQFPDDSGDWYAPEQGQPFPITIPADPTAVGSNWYLQSPSGVYRGLWPDTGGSANKGDTYQTQVSGTPTGQYFTALQDTTSNPSSDNTSWRSVISDQSVGGLTNYQSSDLSYATNGILLSGLAVDHVEGQIWTVRERVSGNGGGGDWEVKLSSSFPPNTYNIVAIPGDPSLSLVLVEEKQVLAAQYHDDPTDVGAAWNFADARANTEGWPLILPAGTYQSSIGLTWDGIFHDIIGAGVDLTTIEFTQDVQGVRIRGGRQEGFQLVGIGSANNPTQVGMVIDQNQVHVMRRIRVKGFFINYAFNGGNSSDFDAIFGDDSVSHSWNNTLASPDNNAITCGMMNFKGAGGTAFNFENGTPSNVSQQWKGGTILCQQSQKGFNISGRGHELTIYEEFNTEISTLDTTCQGSEITMLFGTVQDNGTGNDVILHRVGTQEVVQHQFLQAKELEIRDHSLAGQFEAKQAANNTLEISEVGSSAASIINLVSKNGPSLSLSVSGRLAAAQSTNTDLATILDMRASNSALISNSAATVVTDITSSSTAAGHQVTLIFLDANTTIQSNSNIRLAGGASFVSTLYDTLTLIYTGFSWREVSRSVNA